MLYNVGVDLKTAKNATALALLVCTYLQRAKVVGIVLMFGVGVPLSLAP